MRSWITAALCAAAFLLATSTVASAQESDVEQAKHHYELGYQALQAGDYQTALVQYQRSYELAPRPRTLFNIAVSEEMLGRLDDALLHYSEFVAMAEERDHEFKVRAERKIAELSKEVSPPPPEPTPRVTTSPPPAPEPRTVARVEPACPVEHQGTLRIVTDASATVSVDGLVIGSTHDGDGARPTLEHALGAGDHHLIVERRGSPSWHGRLHVSPGETVSVEIDFHEPRSTSSRILTWGLAGVGAVGLAAGGTFGVLALRDVARPGGDDRDRGKARALVSDLLLVGGALALYGAWRLDADAPTEASVVRTHDRVEAGP
jgi:hypothetical protein